VDGATDGAVAVVEVAEVVGTVFVGGTAVTSTITSLSYVTWL